MMYLGPILLIVSLWLLSLDEKKKEVANEKMNMFYRVIAISFSLMIVLVLPGMKDTMLHYVLTGAIILIAALFTWLISIPANSEMPEWYRQFLKKFDDLVGKVSRFFQKEVGGKKGKDSK